MQEESKEVMLQKCLATAQQVRGCWRELRAHHFLDLLIKEDEQKARLMTKRLDEMEQCIGVLIEEIYELGAKPTASQNDGNIFAPIQEATTYRGLWHQP